MLWTVYAETVSYQSHRIDGILTVEASRLNTGSPATIQQVIREKALRDPVLNVSLFSAKGDRLAGETTLTPSRMTVDGAPRDYPAEGKSPPRRAFAERLPGGEILIMERDNSQFVEFRRIILRAMIWSGASILGVGALLSVVLSRPSLRRIQAMQTASDAIAGGDLSVRLPFSARRDELDELALIVNRMVDEVERLMTQARTVGESVAHELRTPLTRLRNALDHAAQSAEPTGMTADLLDKCLLEADGVMRRFQALLRIAALEARSRESGIGSAPLSAIMEQVAELYEPLAMERSILFHCLIAPDLEVRADGELLFEAVSNLIDNAIKFTAPNGEVQLILRETAAGPEIEVKDNGPGIPVPDRALVTHRFYRSQDAAKTPGFGLGLSLVSAVARLHRFPLFIEDAEPGVKVRILCAAAWRPSL